MAKKMKTEQLQSSSSWSYLPEDIIISILNRLYYIDQIRFRVVCKSWREANIQGMKSAADKLPWNLAIDARSRHVYLYDPTYRKTHTIETGITRTGMFTDARVVASKYGWLIFTDATSNSLFFYSPFTNQIVTILPNLPPLIDGATFTAPPDSPDCEIFLVRWDCKEICIFMCRLGDTTWTKWIKDTSSNLIPTTDLAKIHQPSTECVDGVVYVTLDLKAVFAFNTKLKDWKLYQYPLEYDADYDIMDDHLIESDGNLLLCLGGWERPCEGVWEATPIFRLDEKESEWIRVVNPNNRSLFLGIYTSSIFPVNETSELVNTIHSERCHHRSPCSMISQIYDWDKRHLPNYWIQLPKLRS